MLELVITGTGNVITEDIKRLEYKRYRVQLRRDKTHRFRYVVYPTHSIDNSKSDDENAEKQQPNYRDCLIVFQFCFSFPFRLSTF